MTLSYNAVIETVVEMFMSFRILIVARVTINGIGNVLYLIHDTTGANLHDCTFLAWPLCYLQYKSLFIFSTLYWGFDRFGELWHGSSTMFDFLGMLLIIQLE